MGSAIKVTVPLACEVEIVINDWDAINRVTGPNGDEWRARNYGSLRTEQDVIGHFAFNCLANGCTNVCMLDGWADLPASAVSMRIQRDSIEVQDVRP